MYFLCHDDVIKWNHFPRYWPFVRGIYRSPVNSLHKGQWRGALMFSLICACINGWVNNGEAGDLRRRRAHFDVIVMVANITSKLRWQLSNTNVTYTRGFFYKHGLTLIPAWITCTTKYGWNYSFLPKIPRLRVWCLWMNNFTPHFMMGIVIYAGIWVNPY